LKNLHILVLEDDREDFEAIEWTLRSAGLKFEIEQVNRKEDFVKALKINKADVILSDHFMPQFNSSEALKLYREFGIQVPFILVTGAVSEEFAATAIKDGADDYVLKSNMTRLPSAIINAIKKREAESANMRANNALRTQYEELTKINSELDGFVHKVSHNLRSPLMSILGIVDIGKREDKERDGYFSEHFQMIEKSIHNLDEVLKEMLVYARNARQDIAIQPIDIRQLIAENLSSMEHMQGASRISKSIVIEDDASFFSDRHRISVVLNNLISNAFKYYDPAKEDPFLRIYVQITKEKVVMIFSDNGIGIDREYLAKVFDMFFRATQINMVSGLGLYIVQEAVHKLKGEINVESQIGRGTTFRIEMPNYSKEQQISVSKPAEFQ
jgi:signal transduction histidine kinase